MSVTISSIRARNYRNLVSVRVPLGQLTVLVGRNNAGKSNILDALRFMQDVINHDIETAVAQRGGYRAVRTAHPQNEPEEMTLGLKATVEDRIVEWAITVREPGGYRRAAEIATERLLSASADTTAVVAVEDGQVTEIRFDGEDLLGDAHRFPSTNGWRSYLGTGLADLMIGEAHPEKVAHGKAWGMLRDHLKRMRLYNTSDIVLDPEPVVNGLTDRTYLTSNGDNLEAVLHHSFPPDAPAGTRIRQSFAHFFPGFTDIETAEWSPDYITARIRKTGDPGAVWLQMGQMPSSVVRLLGILTVLQAQPPASVVGFDNPDLGLATSAHASLGEDLEEASQVSQVIACTHSPELLDGLPAGSVLVVEQTPQGTVVGPVASVQRQAVDRGLFSLGELHYQEGLRVGDSH